MLARILTPKNLSPENSYIHFPERRKTLLQIENKVSQLLTLSDYLPVKVALATYGANFLNQVPLWMMMVAPPSSGKTEILGSMYKLPFTESLSDVTKASFMSGTSKKDKSKDATGGILEGIGELGFFIFKDMTSLLSKNKDAASEVFAILREVYDGDYSRHFGNDGGTHKEWHGRIGLLAAVTSEIEKFRSAFSAMGDRFLTVRVYNSLDLRMEQARAALKHSGTERRIRHELQALTGDLFQGFKPDTDLGVSSLGYIHDSIVPLAGFVAACRTPVERNSYSRDTEFIHSIEGYARRAKQLYGLFCGCITIGCSLSEAWLITLRVGLDTIPEQRSKALEDVISQEQDSGEGVFTVKQLRSTTRLPHSTIKRIIEELYSVNVLDCSFGTGNSPTDYWLSDNSREMIDSFTLIPEEPVCNPENLDDHIPTHSHEEKRDYKETEVGNAA